MQAMWPQEQQAGWPRNPAFYTLDSPFTCVRLCVHMGSPDNTQGLDNDPAVELREEQTKLQQNTPLRNRVEKGNGELGGNEYPKQLKEGLQQF